MSDPVTNVEIEDVLSSIRRLVSGDSGRTRRAPAPEVAPIVAQKLVLTEAYRIEPDKAEAVDEHVGAADLSSDYTRTLERRIAELEAAVTAQAAEYEPDGSEDIAQHRPTAVLFAAPRQVPSDDGAVMFDALVADTVIEDPVDGPAPEADFEDEAPEAQHEPRGDVDTPDEPVGPSVQEEAHVEHATMWADDEEPVLFRPDQDNDPDNDRIEVLDAESHRNTARRNDEAEFSFSNDDTLIDEETLRDMVAEIVREELQGALGERITRNVRKLVRREIMRAISIRDFE